MFNTGEDLLERARVEDVVTRLFVGTDERDWPTVLACFAERVLFDMQSMTGQEPATVAAAEITNGWEAGLRPLQGVHHQVGNFLTRVSGTSAHVSCYGIALHYLPNPSGNNTRTFVGSYDFGLTKDSGAWRIDRFKFSLKFVDGNLELERSAEG